jgi:hypothetical protein
MIDAGLFDRFPKPLPERRARGTRRTGRPVPPQPAFRPVIHPTLETGVQAMVIAAMDALAG